MATLALPVMGVLVSYGGTLLLSLAVEMGIVVGVQAHRKVARS